MMARRIHEAELFYRQEYEGFVWDGRVASVPFLTCEWCGEEFKPTRSDAKFCSNAHRQAAHRTRHSA